MAEKTKVIEGWSGPGRRDLLIEPLKLADDGLHNDLGKRSKWQKSNNPISSRD